MIRDFRPDDQVVVRQLILDGLRDRWGDDFDESFNPDLDDIASRYLSEGAEVVVVEDLGAIVATGILLSEDGSCGRIVRMSVAASTRRQGVATLLVQELIGRAARRGMKELRVSTDTPWASAVALYRSCGFGEIGRDETDTHFSMTLQPLPGP